MSEEQGNIRQEKDHFIYTLPNGIRVIYKQVEATVISHCGFVIDAGSRDESPEQNGVAHFIEHMLFKGTAKRRSIHVLNRLEVVGGDLNAYTTKDKTCVYASFVEEYFDRAVELLTDITFHSNFPEKEIEKEKKVIMEEIAMYADNPDETIFDDFQERVYRNHPLGTNILGTKETVGRFTQADIAKFMADNYTTDRIVFSYVGKLPFKKVKYVCDKYLGTVPENIKPRKRAPFHGYEPFNITKKTDNVQTYGIMGNLAYEQGHPKKTGLHLLNNILGGPGLNSRLNLSIREKYGFTYNIESNYFTYADSGLFSIFIGTDREYLDKSINLIFKELKKLREVKMSPLQFKQAKRQFAGQIIMAEENRCTLMLVMGKSLLEKDRVETLQEVLEKIDRVTSDDIMEIANEILMPEKMSHLYYFPKE